MIIFVFYITRTLIIVCIENLQIMMTEQLQKKVSKSKNIEWIDYSSEQENQHHQEKKLEPHLKEQNHPKLETTQNNHNHKNQNYLPVLSTSHEPVKQHLLEDKKELLNQLRRVKGDSVWVELSVFDSKSYGYLNDKIDSLKSSNNKQIISIYPSRDNKNAFDLRVEVGLCEKWIVEGLDQKNIIKLELRRKTERQREPKYDEKTRYYRPIKQYEPQHTTCTRYQPKYAEKKKYVEKNPETEKIEQKVQEELNERKQQKKEQSKKEKGSKFYSKNPFEALNDSN